MDLNRFAKDDGFEPLCKFGPGGDYVSGWPVRKNAKPEPHYNPIGKILVTIADMIGAAVDGEILAQLTKHADIEGPTVISIPGENTNAKNITGQTDNAKAVPGAKQASGIRSQSMLFSDDCRTGKRNRRKQAHSVRTHRGFAKKGTHQQIAGQGTLFEINPPGVSAA